MALHSLYCADVPLRNCSLTHSSVIFGMQIHPVYDMMYTISWVVECIDHCFHLSTIRGQCHS